MKRHEKKIARKITDQCLKTFMDEDYTQSEISRACEMTRQAVHQRMKVMGVPYGDMLYEKRKTQAKEIIEAALAGDGISEISRKLSYSHGMVRKRINEFGIRLIDKRRNYKRIAEILFLRTKGFSKKEIKEELNLPCHPVRYRYLKKFRFVHGSRGY